MPNFLQQLSFPGGWHLWGVAGAGIVASWLAFFAARRFLSAHPTIVPERPQTPPEPLPDPFEVGSQSEKRVAARRKGPSIEVQLFRADMPDEALIGWVFNRSLGGLGISAENRFESGTVLKVRPRSAPTAPWVEVEVRSCNYEDGTWLIGCAFRKTPPYNVLLLFD